METLFCCKSLLQNKEYCTVLRLLADCGLALARALVRTLATALVCGVVVSSCVFDSSWWVVLRMHVVFEFSLSVSRCHLAEIELANVLGM